jgi:MoaA/NifB/PqqE/SkfB family radical SAM enzyme
VATSYFVNVNFVCNERCVFCAADLAGGTTRVEERRRLTLDDLTTWLDGELPGPADTVALAGGEPTLHRELFEIVRHLAQRGPRVNLFTNGLRFADERYAREAVDAGITRFEIALFGPDAATHDAVTRRPGSFECTIDALNVLGRLRRERDFVLEVRLLVSRQTATHNPAIVGVVHDRIEGVDVISLNRLILSEDAVAADATISWEEARSSINETATLSRELGYQLRFDSMPLCVFDGPNADHVRLSLQAAQHAGPPPAPRAFRYLDPVIAAGRSLQSVGAPTAMPPPCAGCEYVSACRRVEEWYVERYGSSGLRPMRLEATAGARPGE